MWFVYLSYEMEISVKMCSLFIRNFVFEMLGLYSMFVVPDSRIMPFLFFLNTLMFKLL